MKPRQPVRARDLDREQRCQFRQQCSNVLSCVYKLSENLVVSPNRQRIFGQAQSEQMNMVRLLAVNPISAEMTTTTTTMGNRWAMRAQSVSGTRQR
jgi:hypothetical protein